MNNHIENTCSKMISTSRIIYFNHKFIMSLQEIVIGYLHQNRIQLYPNSQLSTNIFSYHIIFKPDFGSQIKFTPINQQSYNVIIPTMLIDIETFLSHIDTEYLLYFSSSISIEQNAYLRNQIADKLTSLQLNGKWNKGQNFYRFKMTNNPQITRLDLMMNDEGGMMDKKGSRFNLFKRKMANAYEYCSEIFKDQYIPKLLDSQIENIGGSFEHKFQELSQIYIQLTKQIPSHIKQKLKRYSFGKLQDHLNNYILKQCSKITRIHCQNQLSPYQSFYQQSYQSSQLSSIIDNSIEDTFDQIWGNHETQLRKQHEIEWGSRDEKQKKIKDVFIRIVEDCVGRTNLGMIGYKIMKLLVPKMIENSFYERWVKKSEYGCSKKLRELSKMIRIKQKQFEMQKSDIFKIVYEKTVQLERTHKNYQNQIDQLNKTILTLNEKCVSSHKPHLTNKQNKNSSFDSKPNQIDSKPLTKNISVNNLSRLSTPRKMASPKGIKKNLNTSLKQLQPIAQQQTLKKNNLESRQKNKACPKFNRKHTQS